MEDINILFYYDSVKYIKNVDSDLYKLLKKIRSLKKDKTDGLIKYFDRKNNKEYNLRLSSNTIDLFERNHTDKRNNVILSIGKNYNNEYIIAIPNTFIKGNTIYSLYKLYDQTYNEIIFIDGDLRHLFDHFKIKPTRSLSSDIEKQLISLYLIHNSSYPVIMECIENEFTELNEENFTYLTLKLS